ncbi:MAG: AMP-binding protein [Alphaproteobacteria bacterium]|nr:AMP-binding protein [Alphaproteobacteria bacterium]
MPGDTAWAFLDNLAARYGAAPAFVYRDEPISFHALAAESRRAAQGLADLGVTAGDRVALWLPNVPAWPVLFFACARLGAIAVAVNTRFRSAEVADIVGRSDAKILAFWPGFKGIDFPGILADIPRQDLPALETLLLYEEDGAGAADLSWPAIRYSDLFERPPLADGRVGADAGAVIFTTSGTTRAPKFVLHAQRSLVAHAGNTSRAFAYAASGSVLLQALPLCGTFGHAQMMAGLAAGRPSILLPAFDGPAACAMIRECHVTHFNGSDEMFHRLFDADRDRTALRSLVACGFAAFDPSLGGIVIDGERHGVRLHGLYGMSEVQALFSRQPPERPVAERALAGGLLTAETARVRAVDPESRATLAHGQNGELEVSGPSLMSGYDRDPEATAAAMTDDGFLRTGDLGHTTGDGGFVFLSRMGDVLRLGGYLVSPAEIETQITDHPSVAECQVVGVDTRDGPRAVAFVIATEGAAVDGAALTARCRRNLAGFKVPAAIVAIDAFPVTQSPNGVKIQRGTLRAMARQHLTETI